MGRGFVKLRRRSAEDRLILVVQKRRAWVILGQPQERYAGNRTLSYSVFEDLTRVYENWLEIIRLIYKGLSVLDGARSYHRLV